MENPEKIKVYLKRPYKLSDSSYYRNLIKYPPKNVSYGGQTQTGIITRANKRKYFFHIKQFVKHLLRDLNIAIPNAYFSKDVEEYDLIHCNGCMSKNKMPWVADMEYEKFWVGVNSKNIRNPPKKKVLKYLNSNYCKKIMPWTEWSKENIIKEFPEIKDKIEVVYPAVPSQKKISRKGKNIQILFVARDFHAKGGKIVLDVMNELINKYANVGCIVISDVPQIEKIKYKQNKKIKFMGLVPQDKLFKEIYPQSDIFLYPTFSDTFGFAVLEAKSFGLPVVAMETGSTHTIRETISEGTGFVIENHRANMHNQVYDEKIVSKIYKKLEKLILDKNLRNKMSENSWKEVKEGKFSIKERNKKLKKIYKEALK